MKSDTRQTVTRYAETLTAHSAAICRVLYREAELFQRCVADSAKETDHEINIRTAYSA